MTSALQVFEFALVVSSRCPGKKLGSLDVKSILLGILLGRTSSSIDA
jgi:hypothetical protein